MTTERACFECGGPTIETERGYFCLKGCRIHPGDIETTQSKMYTLLVPPYRPARPRKVRQPKSMPGQLDLLNEEQTVDTKSKTKPEPTITIDEVDTIAPPLPTAPFTILIDNREQGPYAFRDIRADAEQKYQVLKIPTRLTMLKTGDYSIDGYHTDGIAVERKSPSDLFQTLGKGRSRFQDEFARLGEFQRSFVVIECNLTDILLRPPEWSKLTAKAAYRTILSWQIKYPHTHWLFCGSRRLAEVTTYRILEKYWIWKQQQER